MHVSIQHASIFTQILKNKIQPTMVRKLRVYILFCVTALLAMSMGFHTYRRSQSATIIPTPPMVGDNPEIEVEEWVKTFRINKRRNSLKDDHRDQGLSSEDHPDNDDNGAGSIGDERRESLEIWNASVTMVTGGIITPIGHKVDPHGIINRHNHDERENLTTRILDSRITSGTNPTRQRGFHLGDFLSEKDHFIYTILSHVGIKHDTPVPRSTHATSPLEGPLLHPHGSNIPRSQHLDNSGNEGYRHLPEPIKSNPLLQKEPTYDQQTNGQSFKTPTLPRHLRQAHQANTELIEHIRDHWLYPPSRGAQNLYNPERLDYSQLGQSLYVDKVLQNRSQGFYVEAGASDGERRSNSLFFELYHGWDGLLVEPNPYYFRKLLSKNRHAYMLNTCLSPTKFAIKFPLLLASEPGGTAKLLPKKQVEISDNQGGTEYSQKLNVQCFPLYSVLAAIGVSHVDYLSLDVEGTEIDILRTLPLQKKVTVDIFGIEKRVFGSHEETKRKQREIQEILQPYGYKAIGMNKLDIFIAKV